MTTNHRFVGIIAPLVPEYSYKGRLPVGKEETVELDYRDARILAEKLPDKPVCFEHMYKYPKGDSTKEDYTPVGKVLRAWVEGDKLMGEFEVFSPDVNPTLLQKLVCASLATRDNPDSSLPPINYLSLSHAPRNNEPCELTLTEWGARPGCTFEAAVDSSPFPPLYQILASAKSFRLSDGTSIKNDAVDVSSPSSGDIGTSTMLAALDTIQNQAMGDLPPERQRAMHANMGHEVAPPPPSAQTPPAPEAKQDDKMAVDSEGEAAPAPEDPEQRKIWAMELIQKLPGVGEAQKLDLIKSLSDEAEKAERLQEELIKKDKEIAEAKEGMQRAFGMELPKPPRDSAGRFAPQHHETAAKEAISMSDVENMVQKAVAKARAEDLQKAQAEKAKRVEAYQKSIDEIVDRHKRKSTQLPVRDTTIQLPPRQEVVMASDKMVRDPYELFDHRGWDTLPETSSFHVVASRNALKLTKFEEPNYKERLVSDASWVKNHPFNIAIELGVKKHRGVADCTEFYSHSETDWYKNRNGSVPMIVTMGKGEIRGTEAEMYLARVFPGERLFR